MSLKLALKILKSLGLTELDAQIYVYLAKKGPFEEKNLIDALNMSKNQVLYSLENLVTKGMVSTSPEYSIKYSAIQLDKVLGQIMETRKEQTKALQTGRDELLSTWYSFVKKDASDS